MKRAHYTLKDNGPAGIFVRLMLSPVVRSEARYHAENREATETELSIIDGNGFACYKDDAANVELVLSMLNRICSDVGCIEGSDNSPAVQAAASRFEASISRLCDEINAMVGG